jgi:hypothetical protein
VRRAALVPLVVLILLGAVAVPALSGVSPVSTLDARDRELQRVRELYFAAVQESEALELAEREIERLLASGPDRQREAVLTAYAGALRTLRAKHGRWPVARLRDLQSGLEILDDVVERHPNLTEARYLRLMSCYYLPGILGRGASVREDFVALARLLPSSRAQLPADLYEAVAGFVLENGDLPPTVRAPLERSLGR